MSKETIAQSPLQEKRVLVTRTQEQASALSEKLRALGAIPLEFPTIRIQPPRDWSQLDHALAQLYVSDGNGYDWLIFTSVNGVKICCERLCTLGYDPQAMHAVRVAAIGPATAATLRQYGVTADLVPDEYRAEAVAEVVCEDVQRRGMSLVGQRILLARAAQARKVLYVSLQQAGALVDEVPAYDTIAIAHDDPRGHEVLRLLQKHQIDIVTFTSSSTVRNFMTWLEHCRHEAPISLMKSHNDRPRIACIGPITAQTARELGLSVAIEAREFTIDGLIEAMIQAYNKDR